VKAPYHTIVRVKLSSFSTLKRVDMSEGSIAPARSLSISMFQYPQAGRYE
jgi:hypothetical protein